MLWEEILTEARSYLDEELPGDYEDEELDVWLQHGIKDLYVRLGCMLKTITVAYVDGVGTYSLTDLGLGGQGDALRRVLLDSGVPLSRINQAELDGVSALGTAAGGSPQYYTVWGDSVQLHPVPDTSGSATIFYLDTAPATLVTGESPALPAHAHPLIALFIASRALWKAEERQMADSFNAQYEAGVAIAQKQLASRDTMSVDAPIAGIVP
jgi:hypothetical protein